MRFRLLGPLTVDGGGNAVALGGVKQRATLGYLLLNANQVVASSRLLGALWADGERPASARKILHNAVWRLRVALSAADRASTIGLATRSPGYILTVDPADVDLLRFRDGVAAGRAKLAEGAPEAAAHLLRGALRLWQGPALADLAEEGMCWPELDALAEARIDAQEDWFDAELACGRHQTVLGDLRTLVNDGPLRERACGQLMLALYRCGRQAEALVAYTRTRVALNRDLGLEPGQDLQRLQRAILNHDPAIRAPRPPRSAVHLYSPVRARPVPVISVLGAHVRRPPQPPAPEGVHGMRPARHGTPPARQAADRPAAPAQPKPEPPRPRGRMLSRATVLTVRAAPAEGTSAEPGDETLAETAARVRGEVERAGGVVLTAMGATSLAVFGLGEAGAPGSDAERAVRAAVAVRERLGRGACVRAAVATGPLPLPDLAAGAPVSVTGVLVDRCQALLAGTPPGEIQVCGTTRSESRSRVSYAQVEADVWAVRALSAAAAGHADEGDWESELTLVASMIDLVGRRGCPHLVTVLGAPGTDTGSFLAEVRRRHPAVALSAGPSAERPTAAYTRLLATRCGITGDEPLSSVRAKLVAALGDRPEVADLLGLFDPGAPPTVPATWWWAMAVLHRDNPLVVTVDDVHAADPGLLALVRALLTAPYPIPLCVVAGARGGELCDRAPAWGGGIAHTATITLGSCEGKDMDRAFRHLLSDLGGRGIARAPTVRHAAG